MKKKVRYRGTVADSPIDAVVRQEQAGTGGDARTNFPLMGRIQDFLNNPDNRGPDVWIHDVPKHVAG
jgi:hypothetical protein